MPDQSQSVSPNKQTTGPIVTSRAGDLSDVIIASAVGLILFCGLIWFAKGYANGQEFRLLILVGIVGAAGGWIGGILASPYDSSERSSFAELAKLVYGFLTGYVVSKIDPLVSRILNVGDGGGKSTRPLVFGLFAVASFMIAIAATYITRSYWNDNA